MVNFRHYYNLIKQEKRLARMDKLKIIVNVMPQNGSFKT
jgi:hypothetical protein